METRKLGKGGPEIGCIGLGCMSFSGFYGKTDEAESHATLTKALDLGINHLDIANIYGNGVSESVVGSFIKKNGNPFSIATKAGIMTAPKRGYNNEAGYLRQCLEESFQRLNVDYVDLFYIHRREPDRPIEEVTQTLADLVKEGKIGAFGFSEISPASLERANAIHHVAAVQSEYSLWTRQPELGLLQACKRLETALVAFSPVARGMLSNNMPTPDALPDGDFRKNMPRFLEPNYSFNAAKIKVFNDYANDRGWAPSGLANAWLLARGEHVIPIPGTRSVAHLVECAQAADIQLTATDLAEIEEILPIGFAHGDRYSDQQNVGPERFC